uniref:Bm13245 n=1 Tax=Brugia malayi TaxID=6279 RepID=A0A0H5S2N6_BRUMA|nr:Bm13245 [Brugia malayi]
MKLIRSVNDTSILITAPKTNKGIRPNNFINGPKTRLQTASATPNPVITNPIWPIPRPQPINKCHKVTNKHFAPGAVNFQLLAYLGMIYYHEINDHN